MASDIKQEGVNNVIFRQTKRANKMTQWFYSGTVMDKEKRKQEVGIYLYLKKIAKQLSI